MKVAIGCDKAGYALKETFEPPIAAEGREVEYFGAYDNNRALCPDIGHAVATAVAADECESGVLMRGTGIATVITAEKVKGVRAGQRHDACSAERARESYDAQIIAMAARVIGPDGEGHFACLSGRAFQRQSFGGEGRAHRRLGER